MMEDNKHLSVKVDLKNLYCTLTTKDSSKKWYESKDGYKKYVGISSDFEEIKKGLLEGKKLNDDSVYNKTQFKDKSEFIEMMFFSSSKIIATINNRSRLNKKIQDDFQNNKKIMELLSTLIIQGDEESLNLFTRACKQEFGLGRERIIWNRFVAACTDNVTTVANTSSINALFRWLASHTNFSKFTKQGKKVSECTTWYSKSEYISCWLENEFALELKAEKINGIDIDKYWLNCFAWILYKEILMKNNLNVILYGPPGTGKTYRTINKAIEICDVDTSKFTFDSEEEWRRQIKVEFNNKIKEGQIVFTTFHQSMSYEDFVEGIKPSTSDGQIIYNIEDGIFKSLCLVAKNYVKKESKNSIDVEELLVDFVSDVVGSANECLTIKKPKNKTLTLTPTYDASGSFQSFVTSGCANGQPLTKKIILRDLQSFIDGKITSSRDIKPTRLSKKEDHGNSIYYFDLYKCIKDFLGSKTRYKLDVNQTKNFVLIIDEINRGNVSQIFGELITLIEEDKRLGHSEEISITLPYSKEPFMVPPNLYIIGTMNTADRSVEALDTALRRRFVFKEVGPDSSKIKIKETEDENKINLQKLLDIMNRRIRKLLDDDHMIGHSYFMNVKNVNDLNNVFRNNIIPLLKEYFFGNYSKIGLILGDRFVQRDENDKDLLMQFKSYEDLDLENSRKTYSIKPRNGESLWTEDDFKSIYGEEDKQEKKDD